MVKEEPPSHPYIENIPYISFSEGSLALMWDKKRGEPNYDERNEVLWLGPYIIKKKFQEGKILLVFHGWEKISLPIDGSLL
jgi:hypothetical protein